MASILPLSYLPCSVILGKSPASLIPGYCRQLRAGSLNLSYLRSLPKRCVISEL